MARKGSGFIDVHTHAIARDLPDMSKGSGHGRWPTVESLGAGKARILVGGVAYRDVDERCWSADRRLEDMDAGGILAQVVSPLPVTFCYEAPAREAAELAKFQNAFLAELASQGRGRLHALGTVPMQDTGLAVAELERCVRSLGFLGVEIGPYVGATELYSRELDPFFEAAEDLGALLFLHPSDQMVPPRYAELALTFSVGMPVETATATAALLCRGLFDEHPRLKLCLAHGGGALPTLLPRIEVGWAAADHTTTEDAGSGPLAQASSLFCDSLTYDTASLRLCVERFGEGQIVFGSDYPFLPVGRPLNGLLPQDIDPSLRTAIGAANATELMQVIAPEGWPSVPSRKGAVRPP